MGKIIGIYDFFGENIRDDLLSMLNTVNHPSSKKLNLIIPPNQIEADSIQDLEKLTIDGSSGMATINNKYFVNKGIKSLHKYQQSYAASNTIISSSRELQIQRLVDVLTKSNPPTYEQVKSAINGDQVHNLAIISGNTVVLSRSSLGINPFYFNYTRNRFYFASERKALWKLGLDNIESVAPGEMIYVAKDTFHRWTMHQWSIPKQKSTHSFTEAATTVLNILRKAIGHIKEDTRVGVLVSGGIDSSIIAKLCAEKLQDLKLYTVYNPDDIGDITFARQLSDHLNLKLTEIPLIKDEVKSILPTIIETIESDHPLQVSIALPIYIMAKQAHHDQVELLVSGGGGPDELFAGYRRHEVLFVERGYQDLERAILLDIKTQIPTNLTRDICASQAWGLDLFCPYMSSDMVEYALQLPLGYKIQKRAELGVIRKLVLRGVGNLLELPKEIIGRKKTAIQYGSGTDGIVKTLSKEAGYSITRQYLRELNKESQ